MVSCHIGLMLMLAIVSWNSETTAQDKNPNHNLYQDLENFSFATLGINLSASCILGKHWTATAQSTFLNTYSISHIYITRLAPVNNCVWGSWKVCQINTTQPKSAKYENYHIFKIKVVVLLNTLFIIAEKQSLIPRFIVLLLLRDLRNIPDRLHLYWKIWNPKAADQNA